MPGLNRDDDRLMAIVTLDYLEEGAPGKAQ